MSTIEGSEVADVLGYINCFGGKDASNINIVKDTTASPVASDDGRRLQAGVTQEQADAQRQQIEIDCFSYDSSKITGKQGAPAPDYAALSLDVKVGDDTTDYTGVITTTVGIAGGIIAAIIIVVVVMAIIAALVAVAVKRQREEEHERKAEIKEKADQAEAEIDFHMDEMDAEGDLEDIESSATKMKAERDRLKEENEKLAADVGEDPLFLASTEDPDVLVEQIKSLKGENDRLRDMQQSGTNTRRKKKKKAEGFGQQQD
jgi:uncharacterized membrane protein